MIISYFGSCRTSGVSDFSTAADIGRAGGTPEQSVRHSASACARVAMRSRSIEQTYILYTIYYILYTLLLEPCIPLWNSHSPRGIHTPHIRIVECCQYDAVIVIVILFKLHVLTYLLTSCASPAERWAYLNIIITNGLRNTQKGTDN
jgi:hypothetical protein